MLKVKFFHTPKNKKFNYKPLYYDPTKEEREKRQKRSLSSGYPGMSIKGSFRSRKQEQRSSGKTSNTRAFIIIAILLLLAYYLYFDKLPFIDF